MKLFSAAIFEPPPDKAAWRRYSVVLLCSFCGLLSAAYLTVLTMDPFGVSPIALPVNRPLVTVQRYVYPQLVRSHRFDSVIAGTSTSMLLDPEKLNGPFQAKFANLAMASATAWEQTTMIELFLREVAQPRAIVIGIDSVWCDGQADRNRITFRGFPDWLYDDNPWNDYPNLLNRISFMSALRVVRFNLGLYAPTTRADGMDTFLPPEQAYDLARARGHIYGDKPPSPETEVPAQRVASPDLPEADRRILPALDWLDGILSKAPSGTTKILAFMPVHLSAHGEGAEFASCKARIADIGRRRGASVIDWRFASPITREDANFWDGLHYRVPIADRIARDLAAAVLKGEESSDGSYRLLAWGGGH